MLSRIRTIVTLIFGFVISAGLISCSDVSSSHDTMIKDFDTLLQASHERGLLNGNVVIAKGGEVIYEKSFGYTNGQKTTELSTSSIFNSGSIAKEFNAAGIMILKERGQLSLDDNVSDYLPQLPIWAADIQIKHLLDYTSGLPVVNWDSISNRADALADLMALETLAFTPGDGYLYSNNNVFLQRLIIEVVSGDSFADFTRENLIKPAGMKTAIVDPPEDTANLVRSFNNDLENDPFIVIPIDGWVFGTARDMLQWMNALYAHKIISAESIAILAKSRSPRELGAIMLGRVEDDKLVYHKHHGSSLAFEAIIAYDAAHDLRLVILTNNKNRKLFEISSQIEAINKGEPYEIPKIPLYSQLESICLKDVPACLSLYDNLKQKNSDLYDFENQRNLNNLGYRVLRQENTKGAISIFSKFVSEFPKSSNAYDSLGEAYMTAKDHDKAIENYNKSLELDPSNDNARKMLADMKAANER